MQNIVSTLQDRSLSLPQQLAYLFLEDGKHETARITYFQLDQQARIIAAYLQENNLFAERVLLLFPSGLEFITAFMGCLYAGAIAVPVNAATCNDLEKSSSIINAIAHDADIASILTTSSYVENIETHYHELIRKKKIVVTDTTTLDITLANDYQPPAISGDTLAYLQYTSGSTSTPKGVMVAHENLTQSLLDSIRAWHYANHSVTLTWAPHSHVYGLVCGLLIPLYHGTLAIIMPTNALLHRPVTWLEAITKYHVTHSGGPNFAYDLCVQNINDAELAGLNLKHWEVAINGGENVRYETLLNFSQKFAVCGFSLKHFGPAYGMSELIGAIAITRYQRQPIYFELATEDLKNHEVVIANPTTPHRKLVSCGRLIPSLKAIVIDPDTLTPVAKGQIGEIWLSGKTLASGYWQRAEETQATFYATYNRSKQNYFRTGDLGFIKNNELCLTGRLKEMIVVHGKKHYPLDLETTVTHALKNLAVPNRCVAFSIPVNNNEEVIFVQELPEKKVSANSQKDMIKIIRRTVAEQHGIHLYGVILVKLNSIPKTPSGKLQRKLCQQRFLAGQLDSIQQEIGSEIINIKPSEVKNNIIIKESAALTAVDFINLVAKTLNIETSKINLTDPVSKYGLDSITTTQLSIAFNEAYHLTLTPAVLFEFTTLGECFAMILAKSTTKPPSTSLAIEMPLQTKDIAIIGMSALFPNAPNLDVFWDNLLQKKDAIQEIPQTRWQWQAHKTAVKWGGFIDTIAQFDASFFNISPREAELMDPQQRLFLQTAWKTIEDAGYTPAQLAALTTGLFVGAFNHDYAELLHKNGVIDAHITTGITPSILANRVSYLLNLHGPSEVIDTACSSSLVAIHHAVQAIQNGDCDIALAGGVNALLTPSSYLTATKAGMLSEDGRCKTFDKRANGYVRGEGVAAILLKPLSRAVADGDHIYGVIKGSAVNHGGHVSSLTVPNPIAQAHVIVAACQRANVPIDTLGYIETHGTGTALGDPIEINGLKKAFTMLNTAPDKKYYCGLGALKTHIGHLEAAAGVAGVIKTLLAMQHQTLPGNLHFEELNPYIELLDSPFYILDKTQPWACLKDNAGQVLPRRAGVSSFGFGGTNAHVILEEAPHPTQLPTQKLSAAYLILFSAKTELALHQRMEDFSRWLAKQSNPSLPEISYTLNTGRQHFEKRAAIVVSSIAELRTTLETLNDGQELENFVINMTGSGKVKSQPLFKEFFKSLCKELHGSLTTSEYREKMLALGNFYTEGYDLNWQKLHPNTLLQRLSLPTYPFAKENYWLPEAQVAPTVIANLAPVAVVENKNDDLLKRIQQDFLHHVSILLKLPATTIQLTASLSELGFDSITFKELATRLETEYDTPLTPPVFFAHNSIQALSQYLLDNYATEIKRAYSRTAPAIITSETITAITPANAAIIDHSALTIKNTQNFEPIAIIGIQGLFPKSKNLEEFWQHLQAGDDLISEIPPERWDWHSYYGDAKQNASKTNSKWGGFLANIDQFDAGFFNISAREANLIDPQQRLLMEVVWQAIEDAGYDPLTLSAQEVGLFVGVEFHEYQALIHAQQKTFHGYLATGNSHALLANRISYFLNLHGPSEVIDTACSSSLVAMHRAITALQRRECTLAIAAGVSLMLDPETFIITSQMGVLSPDGRCKTFDKSANGYVKGEGVAALLLKPLQQAQKEGDFIYGVIKGSAVNHGGKAQSLTAPNPTAQSQLLIKTYTQAGIDPATLTYIEAHGTGTELGDAVEIEGLKQAFQFLTDTSHHKKAYCAIGSLKTIIGHLEPASGLAGVIKVLLSMQHKKIPGNLHLQEINPYIDLHNSPFYLVNKTQDWPRLTTETGTELPRRAGVSSFGFGGTNAHVVLEEAPATADFIASLKPYYLITLSAKQEPSLKQKQHDLLAWLNEHHHTIDLSALAYTLTVGRSHFDNRCALVVSSLQELMESLQVLASGSTPPNYFKSSKEADHLHQAILTELYKAACQNLQSGAQLTAEMLREKLCVFADLYIRQYPIDWQMLYPQPLQRIASLPTYPFNKQRYWFDNSETKNTTPTVSAAAPVSTSDTIDLTDFTLNYLQEIFAEKLGIEAEQINIDDTYEVYGVDSRVVLEITNRLEQDFGTLPKTLLYERNQLHDLAAHLQKRYKEKLATLAGQNLFSFETKVALKKHPDSKVDSRRTTVDAIQDDSIAIIGISGTYPFAKDMDELWENLVQGRNCITEIPKERWDYKDYPVNVGGEEKFFRFGGFIPDIDKFDPLFFNIAPSDAALMDPQERLFMQCAWATLEDAGYNRDSLRSIDHQVGVFAGVTYNFYPIFIAEEWAKGNRLPLDVQLFSIANRISYFLNLKGPSYIIDTACSSSLAAIHLACDSLRKNECRIAIAGGVNLSLHPCKYHMLGSYSFMSDQGRCASFAEGGSGYVPSEGLGAVLLKPLAQAIQDNDQIYGIIKSSSMNHGGKTSGYTVPNPNAQADLIKTALDKAHINPRTISYIEAHGTGTSLGDPIEISGLQKAFEEYTEDKQFCAIGSVKSNIGHLEAAAGMSQLAKVLLQLRHKKLAATIHAEKLNPFIDFANTAFYVQRELSDWQTVNNQPRRAGISSFGAGGTNIHLIVEEYIPPTNAPIISPDIPLIFVLSAVNTERLQDYAQHMQQFFISAAQYYQTQNELQQWLIEACYTAQVGRESMTARLAILATHYQDLIKKLQNYIDNPEATHAQLKTAQATQQKQVSQEKIMTLIQNKQFETIMTEWVNGARIDWNYLYGQQKPRKISLPTYPFAKRRCWIPTVAAPITTSSSPERSAEIINTTSTPNAPIKELDDWLYHTQWEAIPINGKVATPHERNTWLIFSDKELGFLLQDELGQASCVYCFSGEKFEQYSDQVFYINPENVTDYQQLIAAVAKKYPNLKGILYLSALTYDAEKSHQLLYLFQALIPQKWQQKLLFALITRSSQAVTPQDPIGIWQHHLWSLVRIFGAEQGHYQTLLLDLDPNKQLCHDAQIITQEIQYFQVTENHIAYRDQERFALRLAHYTKNTAALSPWTAPEAALITGGLGALGTETAKWLIKQGARYLLLLGQTVLPERSEWTHITEPNLKEKITQLTSLEKSGTTIQYAAVDISDKDAMRAVIQQTEKQWDKPIQGVFHLAGITTDNTPLEKMSNDFLQKILAAKTQGALVLHELFNQQDLNCFILFSSVAALPYFGLSGLSAYAMANDFLNGLAALRRSQGLTALSINWCAWAEKGMSFRYNHSAFLEAVGMATLPISVGLEVLQLLLTLQPDTMTVMNITWPKFLLVNPDALKLPFFAHVVSTQNLLPAAAKTIAMDLSQITTHLISTLAATLTLEPNEIDTHSAFQNYGMDSIIGINFVAKLSEHFPQTVSPTDLYRYPTVSQLAKYIFESSGSVVTMDAEKPASASAEPPVDDVSNLNPDELNKLLADELSELDKII